MAAPITLPSFSPLLIDRLSAISLSYVRKFSKNEIIIPTYFPHVLQKPTHCPGLSLLLALPHVRASLVPAVQSARLQPTSVRGYNKHVFRRGNMDNKIDVV